MNKNNKLLSAVVFCTIMAVYCVLLFFAPVFFYDVKVGAKDFDYTISVMQAIFTPQKTIVTYKFIINLSLWIILGIALSIVSFFLIAYQREGGKFFLIIGCAIFFLTVFMADGKVDGIGWSRFSADGFFDYGGWRLAILYILVFVYSFVIGAILKNIERRKWYEEHKDEPPIHLQPLK